jgi:predicted peptidase
MSIIKKFEPSGLYNHLIHLPKSYHSKPSQRYPLIVFLHGAGEKGNDLEKIKLHGIPKIVEQYPCGSIQLKND